MLVVTTWLPTRERPELGAFVARDIQMLADEHEVEVIHLARSGETLPIAGVSLRRVAMSPANPLSIRRAARVIAERARHVDLVHTMAASSLLPFGALRLDRPWVHTEHWSALLAPSTVGIAARATMPMTARLLAKPDLVIAVGHRLAEAIARHRPGPIVVIPNAVDRPEPLRDRPDSGGVVLVAVGGLIPRKGPDVAIRTVAELHDRGVDARLVWAGDGPMRAELEALAATLGIADRVQILGRIAPDRVAATLAMGHVFLLPTTMETFGVAIAEALVAGRPVVVGADGEQSSFVEEPDGVLVSEQSAAAYSDGVERVLSANADRSAEQIAARARSLFDDDRRRISYSAAYARACSGRQPDVDVVIAVHDVKRRIDRAIRSALSSRSVARVIVVCHGVGVDAIRGAAGVDDDRVEYAAFEDGVPSPAGPFNHGLELATGRFVAIMGSDDELTAGAVDAWRRTAEQDNADVVIAPVRYAAGGRVPTPPTLRRRRLRGAKDRLAYRTAPLGLVSRHRFGTLRLTGGVATGEDLAFTARMWFARANVSRHTGAGEYVIHDGEERVTFTPRPLEDELRAVDLLLTDGWAQALPRWDRTALAVKLWRVTIFGAVHYRSGRWSDEDRVWLSQLATRLRAFAPNAVDRLSRADGALIVALEDPSIPHSEIDDRSRGRRRFLSPAALLPARLRLTFAREAPLRFSTVTLWRRRR